MDYKEILLKSLVSEKYYTNTDLRMNRNYNIMLSSKELYDSILKYEIK